MHQTDKSPPPQLLKVRGGDGEEANTPFVGMNMCPYVGLLSLIILWELIVCRVSINRLCICQGEPVKVCVTTWSVKQFPFFNKGKCSDEVISNW